MLNQSHESAVEIGGMPILFRTHDSSFREMMIDRYTGFISSLSSPKFEFEVELVTPSIPRESREGVQVEMQDGQWHLRRGDFPGAEQVPLGATRQRRALDRC